MSRVAVFGLGPMRWEQSTRLFALPLRTWHFAASLARDRHEVVLFSMRTAAFEGWPPDKVTRVERDGVVVYSLSEHLLHERPDWVHERLRELDPDCVVGVNKDPASIAANFAAELPFWADINGDPMAEAQAKAEVEGSDSWTPEFYRRFVPVLMRADRFSTCSKPQRAALIGQLAMIGRLTGKNASVDLVHAIPNSIDDGELRLLSAIERTARAPDEPFVLLWSGGYNTWSDPELLYEVVDGAMTEEPSLRFVSTGGAIGGHYTAGYDRFRELVAASGRDDRYHFAGWVQTAELPAYYADAHAAILTDRFGYEGLLGARTRMLDWLAAGLPIVSTRLSEVSREIEQRGAGLCSPCGDVDAMTKNLLRLVREPDLAVEMGERGREYARRELRADRQLEALREWAARPERAPDEERRIELPTHGEMGNELRSLARQWIHRTREEGLGRSMQDVRRFAFRRARSSVRRTFDRAGLPGGVRVIELDTPQAPPHEAPRAGALQWRRRLSDGSGGPSVAVVVIAGPGDDPEVLTWTIKQIERQYLERWELVVALQPGAAPALRSRLEPEVEVVEARHANPFEHHVVTRADYALTIGVGDLLRPDALAEMVSAAEEEEADLVYGDEQDVDETNAPRPVVPKPDWSEELLLARPFLGRCVLYSRGRLRVDSEHARDWPLEALTYELALRASDAEIRACRVPRVLSQRFVPSTRSPELMEHERRAAERSLSALQDAVWRRGIDATVERGRRAGTFRLRYPLPTDARLTLVIPVTGGRGRAERCIAALRSRSRFEGLRVVLAVPPELTQAVRGPEVVRVVGSEARRIDQLLRDDDAELVGWMLTDAEVVSDGWSEELARLAARPDVGAVAPRILEPGGRPAWPRGAPSDHVRETPDLPIQCAILRREEYLAAGGLIDAPLERAVDSLAASLRARAKKLLVTPHASLYLHAEPVGGGLRAEP